MEAVDACAASEVSGAGATSRRQEMPGSALQIKVMDGKEHARTTTLARRAVTQVVWEEHQMEIAELFAPPGDLLGVLVVRCTEIRS